MFRPRRSRQYRMSHNPHRGLLLPSRAATWLPPPIRPANSTAGVQRVSDRYTEGLQSHATACHTRRHWFCIRTNCRGMFGNATRFSILFNCSENSSSVLGCIISIICNASINNHQIRQISSRHAINKVST